MSERTASSFCLLSARVLWGLLFVIILYSELKTETSNDQEEGEIGGILAGRLPPPPAIFWPWFWLNWRYTVRFRAASRFAFFAFFGGRSTVARIFAAATKAIDGGLPLGPLRGPSAKFWCSGPHLGRAMFRARLTRRLILGCSHAAERPTSRKQRTSRSQRAQNAQISRHSEFELRFW